MYYTHTPFNKLPFGVICYCIFHWNVLKKGKNEYLSIFISIYLFIHTQSLWRWKHLQPLRIPHARVWDTMISVYSALSFFTIYFVISLLVLDSCTTTSNGDIIPKRNKRKIPYKLETWNNFKEKVKETKGKRE